MGVDHDAAERGICLEGGVLHVASLLSEDGEEELLLRCGIALTLRRDLTDHDVSRVDVCTDADDTIGIQLSGSVLADVGDVVGQLLHTALGIAYLEIVLIDVDGGKEVLADEALIDDDCVLVVVSLPRHVSGEDITSKGELTTLSGEALCKDLPGGDAVALHNDRALVYGGTLIGTTPLGEVILGHLVVEADKLLVLRVVVADPDRIGIDILDHAVALCHHLGATIANHRSLETGADDG